MNKSFERVTLNWIYEHLSIILYKHMSGRIQAREHKTIWALKNPNTHTSYCLIISTFKHNRQSIWAYERATARSLKPPSIETNNQPSVCTCLWISNTWILTYVCKGACYCQNMWHSSIWSTRRVSLGACHHQSMWCVSIQACEQSRKWASKSEHGRIWASLYTWQAKQVRACEHKSIHACEHVNIKASKDMSMRAQRNVAMW